VERLRSRLTDLKQRLGEIHRVKDEAGNREQTLLRDEEAAFTKVSVESREEFEKKLQIQTRTAADERKKLQDLWRRRVARFGSVAARAKERIEHHSQSQLAILQNQQKTTHLEKTHGNDDKVVAFKNDCAAKLAQLQTLEATATARRQHVINFIRECGVRLEADAAGTPEEQLVAGQFESVERRLQESEKMFAAAQQRLGRLIPPALGFAIILIIHALAAFYIQSTIPNPTYLLLTGVSSLICLAVAYSIYHSKNGEAHATGTDLLSHIGSTLSSIDKHKQLLAQELEKGLAALDGERIQFICETYEKLENQSQQVHRNRAESIARLDSRRTALLARVEQRARELIQNSDVGAKQRSVELRAIHDKRLKESTARYNARTSEIETETRTHLDLRASEWSSVLKGFESFVADERKRARANQPGATEAVVLPSTFSSHVYVGDLRIDLREIGVCSDTVGRFSIPASLATIAYPASLSFPMSGSLLLRASPYLRKQALDALFGSVIHLLSSFPPAKAKLTLIDPVGLGQSFAALMHLADYDETLVNGRIWSDPVQIERKLTELTEHMEKVIQKYLRNRYQTIDEYNREAGELAEPYRFLVIADFPTGFSDVAIERLRAIITSGVRCGVYTLILHDSRSNLPRSMDENQIRRNGLVISETGTGLALDDESLARPLFTPDESVNPAAVDAVINAIGKQCREAARVQVPFEVMVPKANWSENSEQGIRVPIGKTGADRFQYLDLGRGTAQHALVAGKTGSGKSNLVHVIITSAALWYSPREVEFYLIDFKKGVEFKTYATNRLPHVRVVAIESDREFGLSVLRRIDKELTRRGELFRRARVQDFAGYRKTADSEPMPRTLLIIDEFQEFFVDDDEVAQDAALLLDRIVRQGRAFGIHVILGSQTLGGTYSLSKSTLGQMAVRIALQSNEADSYLILDDDNAAAALLSRPGEAIYNDMSGKVEGNNPFQAVYLPKENQEPYLRTLRQKAVEEGMESAGNVAIFEGNSLADLRNNPLLREAAVAQPGAGVPNRLWLGEANAVKGPTEVEFSNQSGSNMLIVGHRGGSEVAMCCATVLSLAAVNTPEKVHIRILDGTTPDAGARDRLVAVKNALPYDIEIIDPRQAGKAIEDLAALVKTRQEDAGANTDRYYLLILGLEKFRMLRQDSDFEFSSNDDAAGSPAKAFTDILVEGSSHGLHTIAWCDTLGNLNRTLSRKSLREFESRVLFQMSATDSSELIDNSAANRLGLYNAMLYSVQTGAIEKFRPYALPDLDLIEELGKNLGARARIAQNNPGPRKPR